MCGIVGYIGKSKKTLSVLVNGLEHLEYRGYDSAGIAYIKNNKIVIKKEEGRISNLKNELDLTDESNIGIGHTRWATHGVVNSINSHPHNSGKITIVHNGIIENYQELKTELEKNGYNFKSDTDSEVAAALLDYLYNKTGNMLDAIKEFKEKVMGAYALGIINSDESDTLYAIKKNSPLIIGVKDEEKYIASDVPAIIDETDNYIILGDGEFAKITKNEIEVLARNEIKNGKAQIICELENGIKDYYTIEIQRIFTANNNDNKSMLIKVTDQKLLDKTGGIIQGMSGSPIIQDGKFVGAVTHVLVNDPTTGYAVFADMMLKQMKSI